MNKEEHDDSKLNNRVILIGLWNVLILLYVYADLFLFYRADYISEIISGSSLIPINQFTLMFASIFVLIPILMIVANLFVKLKLVKWLNIIVASVYTLANIGNIFAEPWAYWILYAVIEVIITVLIIIKSRELHKNDNFNDKN